MDQDRDDAQGAKQFSRGKSWRRVGWHLVQRYLTAACREVEAKILPDSIAYLERRETFSALRAIVVRRKLTLISRRTLYAQIQQRTECRSRFQVAFSINRADEAQRGCRVAPSERSSWNFSESTQRRGERGAAPILSVAKECTNQCSQKASLVLAILRALCVSAFVGFVLICVVPARSDINSPE